MVYRKKTRNDKVFLNNLENTEPEPLSGQALALADTNGDGEIDISDATHLQMYLAEFDVVPGRQPA